MKLLKSLLFYSFLFISMGITKNVDAQTGSSCASAKNVTLTSNSYTETNTVTAVYWYKFQASNDTMTFITNSSGTNKLQKMELFSQTCSDLVSLKVDSIGALLPSKLGFSATGLNTNNYYYLKVTPIPTYTTPFTIYMGGYPTLYWSTNVSSGSCTNTQSACFIPVCIGEPICLYFDYDDISVPYDYINFSNGDPTVAIPNDYNISGCTSFTPSTTGTITAVGSLIMPFTIQVVPSAPPTLSVNISPSNPICAETPVCIQSLTNPIIDYSFSSTTNMPGIVAACSGSNTSTFAFPPGNHQIVYTVNAGHTCSNTATYSVSVASMSLSLTATTPTNCSYDYCFNVEPTTCNVGSNVNFEWQIVGPNSYLYTSSGSSQSICHTLPSAGTYTIVVFTPDLLTVIYQSLTIVVPPLTSTVNITASPSNTICLGNSVTLTASGLSTYTWSTGATTSSISVTPTVNTTYTVTGINTLGCSSTKTISITVVPNLTLTASASPTVICAGSSSTLTATGATSYTWTPGALTGASVVVSPTTTTQYTVTGSNGVCSNTKTLTVTVQSQPTIFIVASPSVICSGQSSTLTASGAGTYTWNTGATTASTTVSPTVTTTYTVTGTGTHGNTCTNTNTITVTAYANPTLSVNSTTICAGSSATLTASGATTYSWNPGNLTGSTVVVTPTASTIYTVTGYIGACSVTNTLAVTVSSGCNCNPSTLIGTTGTISASPASNQKYSITNNVTIVGNITFASAEFQLAANITLTVAANSTLTINRSHLYASGTSMWQGIVVLNGGRLDVVNNSLIEDAVKAVLITNNTSVNQVLTVDASIFNKNQTDITVSTYTQNIATYPFTITNSLFTSRLIAPCNSMVNWPLTSVVKAANNPTVSPLETPYINNTNYPVTTLLAPYAGKKPYTAISLSNVGFSNVTTTSSSYQEFVIGTSAGTYSYNVFDNHWIAVNATNSNINVTNSVFQNGFNLVFPSLYSIGIKNLASGDNRRLQVSSTSYTNNCKFYDLTRAVYTQNLHDLNFNYCEIYSTRVFNPSSASQYGAYGVSATSCHYRNVELNNNKIFNIDNGLVFNAGVGSYTVGTTTGNGQYLGSINANNNIIRSHVTGYTPNPSLHYGFKAITLSSILGQANVTQSGQFVNTNNNTIYDYENGIFCSNWPLHFTVSESNNVTIRNTATAVQYGIEHDNNSDGTPWQASFYSQGIRSNFVTATSISTNPSNYAIRSSQNTASAVRCNTVSNTYNGIAYSGTAVQKSFFQYNDFNGNNKYGFVLENAGVIGQQGAPDVGPTDNRWLGTSWVSPNYKTATLGISSATNSPVYIRLTPADFNPSASAYTDGAANVTDYYYSGTTGTLRQGNNASYWGCSWAKPLATGNNSTFAVSNKFGTTPQDINMMEEIILSQASNDEQAQALAVAKEQVFVQLKETPDAMLNSAILTNFYNNTLNSNTDAFANIAQDIAQGDKNIAQSNLTTVSPQNTNEIKHKQFLALLLKYNNQPLSVSDEQQLLSLASGCPSLEGTFVHEARTLYNVAFDKNNSFMDNCVVAANNARMANTQDTKVTDEQFGNSVLLYPNPSHTGEITILTDADTEALDIEINAMNGLNVLKQSVSLSNHRAKLNINATSGIYMVIISNPKTNLRVTKKLVIQ